MKLVFRVPDRRAAGLALALAGAVLAVSSAPAAAKGGRTPSTAPVVVELYTAQGCDTCPQAGGLIDDLAKRPGVLPLTFSVDYWDYLGWEDTFAKPEFTARQRAYDQRLKVREIYTPEAVVDGRAETSGLDADKVDALIKARTDRRTADGPRFAFERRNTRLSVGEGPAPGRPADVWLVRYDPSSRSVKIKSGDNKGKTVTIRNAVRELVKLGQWRGAAGRYAVPAPGGEGLLTVVILQLPHGGRILRTYVPKG